MNTQANAKNALGILRKQIDEIDEKLNSLLEKLVNDEILPSMAQVQEINLKSRRQILQNQFNAINNAIKHF